MNCCCFRPKNVSQSSALPPVVVIQKPRPSWYSQIFNLICRRPFNYLSNLSWSQRRVVVSSPNAQPINSITPSLLRTRRTSSPVLMSANVATVANPDSHQAAPAPVPVPRSVSPPPAPPLSTSPSAVNRQASVSIIPAAVPISRSSLSPSAVPAPLARVGNPDASLVNSRERNPVVDSFNVNQAPPFSVPTPPRGPMPAPLARINNPNDSSQARVTFRPEASVISPSGQRGPELLVSSRALRSQLDPAQIPSTFPMPGLVDGQREGRTPLRPVAPQGRPLPGLPASSFRDLSDPALTRGQAGSRANR